VSVPNLGALISIGGAVCLSTLGLMFPSLIETMVFWDNLGKWHWILWKNILIFIFGLAIFVFGLIGSILELILSFEDDGSTEEGFVSSVKQLAEKYYFI
jgi:solute carrier family 36 (proton-coupled amino acid transporter)